MVILVNGHRHHRQKVRVAMLIKNAAKMRLWPGKCCCKSYWGNEASGTRVIVFSSLFL